MLVPFMGTVAGGVVAIGTCYGVGLSRDEPRKLIREFFKAAGFVWTSAFVGTQFLAWIATATGVGIPVMIALETAEASLIAYVVGTAAKHYFKGQRSRDQIRTVMRSAMSEGRAKFSSKAVDRV